MKYNQDQKTELKNALLTLSKYCRTETTSEYNDDNEKDGYTHKRYSFDKELFSYI